MQCDSNHIRPQKIARSGITSPNTTSPPLAITKHVYRTPTYNSPDTTNSSLAMTKHVYLTPTYNSPDPTNSSLAMVKHAYQTPTYTSPETRTLNLNQFSPIGSDCSPRSCGQCNESEFPRHSLAGQFPSVSLFKDYQNAAMAVSLFIP